MLKTSYRNQIYGSGGNVLLSINKTTSQITNSEFVKKITGALLGVLDLRVLGFGIVFRNFSEIIEKERRMKLVKRFSQNGNEASGTSLKTSQQGSMPSAS